MARPLGSKNRTASNAKGAIEQCFEDMGGVANLLKWAKQNETDFYKVIYPKLLPLTVAGDKDSPLQVIHNITRTIVDPKYTDTTSIPAAITTSPI